MKEIIERGATSQIVHVFIPDSASATGAGKTGLTFNSAGLKVVVMRPGESGATKYLQSAGNIEDITTIGTYAAPTANKCRFKEIDATDLPGWYELHFADALFNTTSSRRSLGGMISGASGVAPTPFAIQLADPVRGVASPTALPNAAAEAAGGLFTRGTGAGQINQQVNGQIDSNLERWLNVAPLALSSQLVQVSVGALQAAVITAASIASDAITAAKIAADAITSSKIADGALTAAKFAAGAFDAVWTVTTRTVTSLSGVAADIRAAVGLAAANLDTQLAALAAFVDTEVALILSRLGAWTGTGRNTVLGALQALFRKDADATVPSDINANLGGGVGTAANTTDSVEAIRDNMGTPQTGDNFARLGAPTGASVSADVAAVKGDTAAIKAKTDNLPADPADASDIAALFDALPTAAENAAALLDLADGVETGLTPRQALRLMAAAMAGKLSGAATTTIVIRNAVADSKNRITATVDADGNRSAVTVDVT